MYSNPWHNTNTVIRHLQSSKLP